MTDVREVLSALIDREPVDADVLAHVLEERENRALLVDFVRLRAALRANDADETAPTLRPGVPPPALTWVLRAVAAIVLLGLGLAGGLWGRRIAFTDAPPEPSRVIQVRLQ